MTISLDSFLPDALTETSRRRRMSLHELIAHVVKRWFEKTLPAPTAKERNFKSIVGLGSRSRTDVSKIHDRFLGEAMAHEHFH